MHDIVDIIEHYMSGNKTQTQFKTVRIPMFAIMEWPYDVIE